jgi:CheY-like chemotaxis protein
MQRANKSDIGGLHLLLFDEDPQYAHILREELLAVGIVDVFNVHSPEEALQSVQQQRIDVLVSELYVPFFRFIRTSPKSPNTRLPIVVVTARADYEHVSAARDAGVNALVVKPVSASDLRDHILDALDKLHHPFVECDAYTGPDRRHESTTAYRGRERRGAPIPLK